MAEAIVILKFEGCNIFSTGHGDNCITPSQK